MGWGPHLEHSHLPTAAEQGYGHTQSVGTEAVTLTGRGEVEPLEVGDVAVSVQDGALSMTELGTGAWGGRNTEPHKDALPVLRCLQDPRLALSPAGLRRVCAQAQTSTGPRKAPGNET